MARPARIAALILGFVGAPGQVLAAEPAAEAKAAPSADSRKAAADEFDKGETAYKAGNFAAAGRAFEAAYGFVPHPFALWNAARAYNRAGETARAANLYQRYLNEAPPDAPDRKQAAATLEKLSPKLGRLDILAPGVSELEIDEQPVIGASVYVNPGSHVIRGKLKGQMLQRVQAVDAGSVASVALVAEASGGAGAENNPSAQPSTTTQPESLSSSSTSLQPGDSTSSQKRPLPPAVVIAGGGLAALGLGLTIWSGTDTLSARDTFDAAPTEENLSSGRAKQTRTNVLLGVTLGVAALTGAAAVFFVDWSGSKGSAKVALGFQSIHVEGSF